jgi:hypothetical protein
MDYDIEVIVKYKSIEDELLEKIKNNDNETNDLGYTIEDVLQITDDLYKHELLIVFQVDTITNKKIQDTLSQIFLEIQNYPNFIKVIEKYKEKMNIMDLEQTFVLMFNYSLFAYIHKCIVSMKIFDLLMLDESLIELEKQINY